MPKHPCRGLVGTAAVAAAVLCSAVQANAPPDAEFAGRWVARDEVLRLRVTQEAQAQWRQWRWFVGTREISALARLAVPGVIELDPLPAPWRAGESELVVHDGVTGSELARWPLRVRDAWGLERSETTRRLFDIGSEGRAADRRSDGKPTSPRTGRADGSTTIGIGWKGQREDWALEAAGQLAGHSQRARALRYAQRGSEAPKLDLAEYRLLLGRDGQMLELGHQSAGTHPLLASGFASRGIGWRSRIAPGADLAVHALRGTSTVGWSDPSGLADEDHRQYLLSAGAELVGARPGALRAELSALDASLRAQVPFNTGVVPDAERTRGLGLRLLGSTEDGRISGELAAARARHAYPFDVALAQQGVPVRPVQPVSSDAWLATLRLALLRASADQPLDLALDLRHDSAEPQYRSSAASVTPDQRASRLGLQAGFKGASAHLNLATRVDNLDRIATLLRTRSDERDAGLTLPLAAWFAAGATAGLPWPTLALATRHSAQRAVNEPLVENSGIAASHRPDQIAREHQLRLDWTLGAHALGYSAARSLTDNRQPGRERADFERLAHQGSLAINLGEAWRIALALQRTRQLSIETGVISLARGGSVQADWRASERLSLSAQWRHDRADDSQGRARQSSEGAQLQLSWRFEMPGVDKKMPGQAFLRLGHEAQRQRDSAVDSALAWRASWLDLGLSFSFY